MSVLKGTGSERLGSDCRGIQPGKEIGEILHQMLEKVLEEPELNEKEVLLAWYFKA